MTGRRACLAFELEGDEQIRVFARQADEELTSTPVPFQPFLLIASTDLLAGWGGAPRSNRLAARGLSDSWSASPLERLPEAPGPRPEGERRAQNRARRPYLAFTDPVQQYLMHSGQTHSLTCPSGACGGCSSTSRPTGAAGTSSRMPCDPRPDHDHRPPDSTGWSTSSRPRPLRGDMLRELVRLIRERDPDVLEGHNLFRFDLQYIQARGPHR